MSGKALILALCATLLGACHSSASGFVGAYDNARYNEESGDLRGFRIWVRDHPNPAVSLRECGNDCDAGQWFPATMDGVVLTFTEVESRSVSDGTTKDIRVRYRATKDGDNLILTSPDIPTFREVLPPAKPDLSH